MRNQSLLIIFSLFQIFICQKISERDRIAHCQKYVVAPNLENQLYRDEVLCIQCNIGFIVSKSYKQCLEFQFHLSYLPYGNCQRIAYNGNCAEAIQGLELNPKNEFVFQRDMKYFNRCAIVSDDYENCLYPRFGYKLDVITKRLFTDSEMSFCAIFNSITNVCIQFQERFIRIDNSQMGAYLGQVFKNLHKLKPESSTKEWICGEGYVPSQQLDKEVFFNMFTIKTLKYQGCIEQQEFNFLIQQVQGEQNNYFDEDKYDVECGFEYARSEDKDQCMSVTPNCQEFITIENKQICIKCYPCFQLLTTQCIYMLGCDLVSQSDPNQIVACNPYYQLVNGKCVLQYTLTFDSLQNDQSEENKSDQNNENINQKEDSYVNESEIHKRIFKKRCSSYGDNKCVRCAHEQEYLYAHEPSTPQIYNCVIRTISLFCKGVIFDEDKCIDIKCSHGFNFNFDLIEGLDLKNKETVSYFEYIRKRLKVSAKEQFDENQIQQQLNYLFENNIKINYDRRRICKDDIRAQFHVGNCIYINHFLNQCLQCKNAILILEDSPEKKIYYSTCQDEISVQKQDKQIAHCIQYDNETKICLQCETDYYYNSSEKKCIFKIKQCFIHMLNGLCFKCYSGFKLSLDQTECSPICSTVYYENNNIYYIANYSTTVNNVTMTKCREIQIPCSTFIDNQCIECFEGFLLDQFQNNECIPDQNYPDCKIIDKYDKVRDLDNPYVFQEKICIQCKQDYVLYAGRCYCQKEDCLRTFSCIQDKCEQLNSSIFKDQLNIKDNAFLQKIDQYYIVSECIIENCIKCGSDNHCLLCSKKYQFDQVNKVCKKAEQSPIVNQLNIKPVINGCEENKNKQCTSCYGQLYLMSDYKCYLECPSNYQKEMLTFPYTSEICYACSYSCLECYVYATSLGLYHSCKTCRSGYFYYPKVGNCEPICTQYIKVDRNTSCLESCGEYYEEGRYCLEKCPNYFMIQGNKKICTDNCHPPMLKYEDSNYCSQFCELGYVTQEFTCIKCRVFGCIKCSVSDLNVCLDCEMRFIFQNGKCIKRCQINELIFGQQECPTIAFCKSVSQSSSFNCEECQPTFILQESFNGGIICMCPTGLVLSRGKQKCVKSDQQVVGCAKYIQSFAQCISCFPPYKLIQEEKFLSLFTDHACTLECPIGFYEVQQNLYENKNICKRCSQLGCLRCNNNDECLECESLYELIETQINNSNERIKVCRCRQSYLHDPTICKYNCWQIKKSIHNPLECCSNNNCLECNKAINICEKCNSLFPFLFLNTCLDQCYKGTFADVKKNICVECHTLCRTCVDNSQNCTSCQLPENLVDSTDSKCRCIRGMFFYQNNCYTRCPRYTYERKEDMICIRYCNKEFQFPVFDQRGYFEKCESDFSNDNSKYCRQNLYNLQKFINFKINTDEHYVDNTQKIILFLNVSQTPRECYSFSLRGNSIKNLQKFPLEFKEEIGSDIFNYVFSYSCDIWSYSLTNKKMVGCNQNECNLYLDIIQNQVIQQTIKLRLYYTQKLVEIIGVQYKNSIKIVNQQPIEVLVNQKNKQIQTSTYYIICGVYATCSQNSIISQSKSPIEIIITSSFNNNQTLNQYINIYPHQQYIQLANNTFYQLDEFYFDNSISSTIKLSFQVDQALSGKLIIVLKAYTEDDIIKYLNIDNEDNIDMKYIINTINIDIHKLEDYFQIQNENGVQTPNPTKYIYLTLISTIISIVLFLFIAYKIVKQLIQNNFKQQKEKIELSNAQIQNQTHETVDISNYQFNNLKPQQNIKQTTIIDIY